MNNEKVEMIISTVDEMSYVFEKTQEEILQVITKFENKRVFTVKDNGAIMAFNPDNVVSVHMGTFEEVTDNE